MEKKLRMATAINVFLPGAGLFYLGRRKQGGVLAGVFLLAFIAVLAIFLASNEQVAGEAAKGRPACPRPPEGVGP